MASQDLSQEAINESVVNIAQASPEAVKRALRDVGTQLSPEDRARIETLAAPVVGTPPNTMRKWLWLIVVVAFSIVLVGSFAKLAIAVFRPDVEAASTQIILTVFTSVVGFLAGLFAPSPVASGQG